MEKAEKREIALVALSKFGFKYSYTTSTNAYMYRKENGSASAELNEHCFEYHSDSCSYYLFWDDIERIDISEKFCHISIKGMASWITLF